MQIYDELVARGLIAQTTDEDEIRDLVNNGKAVFYIGFDPTADSLHVGHFMALCLMKRLQMAGNKPIALIGGGTAMIGDPSGRTDMRQMMTKETIQHNVDCFKKQMSKFIDFSEDKALLVNNADWLLDLNYVDVLRDVGACFSVNNMLRAECYKQRMEKGLSFLEFNYMIMQSYDFYALYQKYGCNMQFGGDDQWSNMLGGTELIRRKLGKDAYAMTITLLLNSEGKKMGKTQKGAVWLDPNKTSPFEFYQYWRNVADADVLKCIRMLTFLPLEEIDKMDSWEGSQLNQAKEILAYELTKLVHGEEEAVKAQESARALFSKGVAADMPSVTLTADDFKDGAIDIVSVLVKSGLVTSRNETLVVGITDFAPMDYQNESGEWVGFDADLAKAFAESLGVKVEFVEIVWDNKVLELDSKTIDCVWNGMTLTSEVTSAMACSNAYCNNAQVVIVPADKAADYQTVESVKDLTFAAEAGSAGEAELTALGYSVTPVSAQSDALMEVAAGTSDAAVIDSLMAAAMVGEGTGYANLTYTCGLNSEEYGVGFRKGSDLVQKLNDFFKASYADGSMLKIAETYGVQAAVIEQK